MPVAGPHFPWGHAHDYPYGPHPMGGVGDLMIRRSSKLGIRVCAGGPVAILSGSRADQPHCIYRGLCNFACKVGAKASTLITHVPDALQTARDSGVVDGFARPHGSGSPRDGCLLLRSRRA
jgi:hypothetical protein